MGSTTQHTDAELKELRSAWMDKLEEAAQMDDDLSIRQARQKLAKINELLD